MRFFNKLITGPLWRIIENIKNILEIKKHLLDLREVSEISNDGEIILEEKSIFTKGTLLLKNPS